MRLTARFRPDVVQVNGARSIKYGAFARYLSGNGPWVLIYRNIDNPAYWVRDSLRRLFYKKLVMPQVNGIVGVSKATLRNVQTLYNLEAPAVSIPNGVNPVPLQSAPGRELARQQMGIRQDVAVVLFMGNLTTQKRPDRFLRVMFQVYEEFPEVEAWILGDGPLRYTLENEANSLGFQQHIRFWGYQEYISPYISAADLLLVTSDSDGIPAVVLEAALLGKPTVATRVGGLQECVLNGKTGILADPQDETGLAHAVLNLLQDPERLQKMGQKATRWTLENFTIDKIASKYLDFYRQILAH